MNNIILPPLLSAAVCLTASCVSHTTYKQEPRQSIRFSSVKAAQTFYEAFIAKDNPKGNGCVVVGLKSPYWHTTLSTSNTLLNAAVKDADANENGAISDAEADAYAARTPDLSKV